MEGVKSWPNNDNKDNDHDDDNDNNNSSGTRPTGGAVALYLYISPKLTYSFQPVIHRSKDLNETVQNHFCFFKLGPTV